MHDHDRQDGNRYPRNDGYFRRLGKVIDSTGRQLLLVWCNLSGS